MSRVAVFLLSVFLVAGSAYALTGFKTLQRGAAQSTGGGGFKQLFQGMGAAGRSAFATGRGLLSDGTLGRLAGGAMRGGLYAYGLEQAVRALLDGLNYLYKEAGDGFEKPGKPRQLAPPGGTYYVGSDGKWYWSAIEAAMANCAFWGHGTFVGWGLNGGSTFEGSGGSVWCSGGAGGAVSIAHTYPSDPPGGPGRNQYVEQGAREPVPDSDIARALRDSGLADQMLNDKDGNPIHTPEWNAARDQAQQELASLLGEMADPDDATVADADYAKRPSEKTDQGGDWPEFCMWASRMCELADFLEKKQDTTAPPDDGSVDLPTPPDATGVVTPPVDVSDPGQFDQGGFGWGVQCPFNDLAFDLLGQTVSVSMQPVCEYGPWMRAFLLLMAAVGCARIIAGLKTGGVT